MSRKWLLGWVLVAVAVGLFVGVGCAKRTEILEVADPALVQYSNEMAEKVHIIGKALTECMKNRDLCRGQLAECNSARFKSWSVPAPGK
jgi:hypothetical protein